MKNAWQKVNKKMMALYVRAKDNVTNEKGVTTVEWVGLAAVIVALMFIVANAMSSQEGDSIAGAIVGKISEMIGSIGSGG